MSARIWDSLRLGKGRLCRPGMNKPLPKRLNWEQIEARPQREGRNVVKGTNKRVVVVKSPDQNIFEQAIFIVRDRGGPGGDGSANIMKEAEKVANEYMSGITASPRSFLKRIPPLACAAIGALLTGAVWLVLHFIGI